MTGSPGLQAIIRSYRHHHLPRALEELRSFAAEPTPRSAIERAGLARRPDGKRYDHQRHLAPSVLVTMQSRLLSAEERLTRSSSFNELHEEIHRMIGSIPGVGELAVYDTAMRIGAKLVLEPDRVFLHRGARVGARALGMNFRALSLELGELPEPLRGLRPHEVEDILCIFKKHFTRLPRGAGAR